jgi:hypothetical protein
LSSPGASPPSASLSNGLYLAVGSSLWGATCAACPAGTAAWVTEPDGEVTGEGTAAEPWVGVTTVHAGAEGPTLTMVATYALGDDHVGVRVIVDPPADNTLPYRLYHVVDALPGGAAGGPAYAWPAAGVPSLLAATGAGGVFQAFTSPSPRWDGYFSGPYDAAFAALRGGGDLGRVLDPDAATDSGLAAQWDLGVVTSRREVSYRVAFGTRAPCADDTACAGPAAHCDPSAGSCFACVTDAHCGPAAPRCDDASRRCRGCAVATQSDDCAAAAAPACDGATGAARKLMSEMAGKNGRRPRLWPMSLERAAACRLHAASRPEASISGTCTSG